MAEALTAEDLVAVQMLSVTVPAKAALELPEGERSRQLSELLPVYDRVVKCALGRPSSFWLPLHTALRADDHALHHTLLDLRKRAGIPETVSALRVCDIVLWMAHKEDHRARRCPGHGTLSV
ncbi:DUF6308 family protein [Streptomyces bauhiniae]|uniref:DUF6308 family protein n=1 Tax=Streptomyces bauhiniae TaxID=2340725 RepID=UPI003668567E